MKRQWMEYVMAHPDGRLRLDPVFTSTYGPVLAARRARFERDEHSAWSVFGRWLRDRMDRKAFIDIIVRVMKAGVFFGYDPMTEVLLPCGWRPTAWNNFWGRTSEQPEIPNLHMRMWVRPHVMNMRNAIMKDFLRDKAILTEGCLVDIMPYMTEVECKALVNDVALMIKKLDYGHKNAAFEVFLYRDEVPVEALGDILTLSCAEDAVCEFRDEAFRCLLMADSVDLKTVFQQSHTHHEVVECFEHMAGFHYINRSLNLLFDVIEMGDCMLSKEQLLKVGRSVAELADSFLDEMDFDVEFDVASSKFEALCGRCLEVGSVAYKTALKPVGWCLECVEMAGEDVDVGRASNADNGEPRDMITIDEINEMLADNDPDDYEYDWKRK